MDSRTIGRGVLALTGAAAGFALWAIDAGATRAAWPERLDFAVTTLAFTFFAAVLAMTGAVPLRRACLGALPVAVAVAGLLSLAALRHGSVASFQMSGLPFVAAFVLGFVPLPFIIAGAGAGWRDYPALFTESWRMVVRAAAAGVFAGLFWGLVWLSDSLLGLVGLGFVEALMAAGPLAPMLTGAALGLGAATVAEAGGDVGPDLLVKLLRLFALPVLVVAVVFLIALPLQGMKPLAGGVSAAGILLAVVSVMITLVSAVVGRDDAEASEGRLAGWTGMALAVLVCLPVALALWALWLRVGQHGWTPGRLFAALVGVIALSYGLGYLASVLRGSGWRGRIRSVNLWMAPVLALAAALWLSPLMDAEAISARDMVARYEAGAMPAEDLDLYALQGWGVAGEAALARFETLAREPGEEALAVKLAAKEAATEEPAAPPDALLAELRAAMPLQPEGAAATRDLLLTGIPAVELESWIEACRTPLPGTDRPGCVFAVADLWTDVPGEEGVVLLRESSGFVRYEGLGMGPDGVMRRSVGSMDGMLPDRAEGEAVIAELQDAPPAVRPAPLNVLGVDGGLILLP